jgi:hypothetical protein
VITKREWLGALAVAVGTAVLLLLPYVLGDRSAPTGHVYMHLIMNPEDSLTYWAKMRQGLAGAWLYTIPFTPEPHQGAAIGLFYVWLGQVARWTGLSLTAVWHSSRFVADVLLFVVTFWFTAVFLADKLSRWTAYLLALFGSGLGWLLFLAGQTYWLGAFPVDFKQPDAHLFFTALTFPHTTLGTAIILFEVVVLKRIGDRILGYWDIGILGNISIAQYPNIWLLAITAGLANILLGIVYPFLIYIVAVTAVLYFLYLLYQLRTIPWQAGFQIALLFLIPAPLYLYYAWVWQNNAVFRAWDAQAGTPSPPWPHYLVAFGLLLLLAALFWWKRPSQRQPTAVLWCWIVAVALLVYAPLGPQRRFVQGVHVALAVLAAAGWVQVILPRMGSTAVWQRLIANPRYTTAKLNHFAVVLFLLLMSLSNLFLLADVARVAGLAQPDLFFRPAVEMAAVEWLQEQGNTAVVLGAYQTGNLLAAHTSNPVLLGHWAETVAYAEKETAVGQFFNTQTSDEWRQAFLAEWNVGYVWFGPREQALGGFDPGTADYLRPVYTNGGIVIYEVET